jgi:hypothetical protein
MDKTVRISAPPKIIDSNEEIVKIRITQQDGKLVDFLIDREDFSRVKDFSWFSHMGYACRIRNGRFWYLTWQLFGRPGKDYVLHHVNENPCDNRGSNLALIPRGWNNYFKKAQDNYSTGIPGISQYANGLYVTLIDLGMKRKSFKILEQAKEARDTFERAMRNALLAAIVRPPFRQPYQGSLFE